MLQKKKKNQEPQPHIIKDQQNYPTPTHLKDQ
jgi:hypothetical protein